MTKTRYINSYIQNHHLWLWIDSRQCTHRILDEWQFGDRCAYRIPINSYPLGLDARPSNNRSHVIPIVPPFLLVESLFLLFFPLEKPLKPLGRPYIPVTLSITFPLPLVMKHGVLENPKFSSMFFFQLRINHNVCEHDCFDKTFEDSKGHPINVPLLRLITITKPLLSETLSPNKITNGQTLAATHLRPGASSSPSPSSPWNCLAVTTSNWWCYGGFRGRFMQIMVL